MFWKEHLQGIRAPPFCAASTSALLVPSLGGCPSVLLAFLSPSTLPITVVHEGLSSLEPSSHTRPTSSITGLLQGQALHCSSPYGSTTTFMWNGCLLLLPGASSTPTPSRKPSCPIPGCLIFLSKQSVAHDGHCSLTHINGEWVINSLME